MDITIGKMRILTGIRNLGVEQSAVMLEEMPRDVIALVGNKVVFVHIPSGQAMRVEKPVARTVWYEWLVGEAKKFEEECKNPAKSSEI